MERVTYVMLDLYLMRHGRTQWNLEGRIQGGHDSLLLPESKIYVRKMAEFLNGQRIGHVFVSPLGRCVETVKIVRQVTGYDYVIDERLRECDHGQCEGMTMAEVERRFPGFLMMREQNRWVTKWPGGEAYSDVSARARSFVDDLYAYHADKARVLIVAHEMFNKCLIGAVLGWSADVATMKLRQENNVLFSINNDTLSLKSFTGVSM